MNSHKELEWFSRGMLAYAILCLLEGILLRVRYDSDMLTYCMLILGLSATFVSGIVEILVLERKLYVRYQIYARKGLRAGKRFGALTLKYRIYIWREDGKNFFQTRPGKADAFIAEVRALGYQVDGPFCL